VAGPSPAGPIRPRRSAVGDEKCVGHERGRGRPLRRSVGVGAQWHHVRLPAVTISAISVRACIDDAVAIAAVVDPAPGAASAVRGRGRCRDMGETPAPESVGCTGAVVGLVRLAKLLLFIPAVMAD
jgi:hypothetical protein